MPGMAPISLQQFINPTTGRAYTGARALFTSAETGDPITVYQDYSLGTEHANPVVADSQGRFPPIYIDETVVEFYGLRITTSSGAVLPLGDGQYDLSLLPVIYPTAGSGGSVTAVDTASIFQTGDVLWVPKTGTRTGWVRLNGRTIGSASSGASERANDDCEDLYSFIWTNYANSICAVTGGRGISAAIDFAANKPIATLDMRNKGPFGLDDMGNSANSGFTSVTFAKGNSTTAGASGGTSMHTLTEAQLPAHVHTQTAQTPTLSYGTSSINQGSGGATSVVVTVGSGASSATTTADATPGDTATAGSDSSHPNMPPFILGSWYWRL